MSYKIVFVGNLPCFNQEIKAALNEKNICSTVTPNATQLRYYLKNNYKKIHLLIIELTNDISTTNPIVSLQTKHLFRDIPFIVVGERSHVMRGLTMGAKDYIVTPTTTNDFISRILVTLESLRFSLSMDLQPLFFYKIVSAVFLTAFLYSMEHFFFEVIVVGYGSWTNMYDGITWF